MKLIDKDALVAEIERRRDLHYKYYMKNGVGSIAEYKYDEDRDILYFLDSMQEEPKKCIYTNDNYTDEDRKVLCEGCEEECKYAQKEEPVEWSEKDDKMLNGIIYTFQHGWSPYSVQIDWLKSLKERYTWKPSDAQMESITCAVRNMKESACYDSELVSLLNDLKKLKE